VNRRTIGIVTSARADFGLLRRLMAQVAASPELELIVYATGMHHSSEHGHTIDEVRAASFGDAVIEVPFWRSGDGPADIAAAMGRGTVAFAEEFGKARPDILVVLGDRYDSYPAALAALPFALPIAHISGGELTEGLIDEAIRHSFTKLAHLHFASTEDYARRICQLGEEPWRVVVSGQPGLDEMAAFVPAPKAEVYARLDLDPSRPVTLVTYHPETLTAEGSASAIAELLAAAGEIRGQIVFTAPNADTGNRPILEAIEAFCADRPGILFRTSLGRNLYMEMLAHADCMVGNSSSGLVEAATFRLPVVNIGERQAGRLAPANVIHAVTERSAIATAWTRALDAEFRASLADLVNPYGDGRAVERIVARLVAQKLGPELLLKRFTDYSIRHSPGHS
jgi:UDP-hydrolysing UDP-N-acetyl-D-glucosamine 2-epimerase